MLEQEYGDNDNSGKFVPKAFIRGGTMIIDVSTFSFWSNGSL